MSTVVPSGSVRVAPAAAPKLVCVDLLRGAAALGVLLFHANVFFWHGPPTGHASWVRRLADATFGFGSLGVSLFFVISGFCIHLPYVRKDRVEAAPFLVRRFWRLYPPYLVAVLVTFAFFVLRDRTRAAVAALGPNLLGHLFFWHYWDGHGAGMGVPPVLWTITVEVEFYLLYLATFRLLRRAGFARAALVWLAIDAAYRVAYPHWVGGAAGWLQTFLPERFALARFGEWLLGAWLAQACAAAAAPTPNEAAAPAGPRAWEGRVFGGAGLIVAAAALETSSYVHAELSLLASVGFASILAGLIAREVGRQRHRPRRVADDRLEGTGLWLAERSYSLYLIHFTMLAAVGVVSAQVLRHGQRDVLVGTGLWLWVTVAGVCAGLVAADLMYRFVEAPSHRLARRISAALLR